MFRLWGKVFRDNHLLKDYVAEDSDYTKSRRDMIFDALRDICREFDMAEPIWLAGNVDDFACRGRVRFNADNFIEQIDFDYLEIQVIEE